MNPAKYKRLISGLRIIATEESARAVWKGWAPTLLGYIPQGALKYGLYEVFKDLYASMAGKEYSQKYKGWIWCAGAASAEFVADIALCPMEMVKVKVQTSVPGTFPTSLGAAVIEMNTNRQVTRFPYGSIVPLWSRQIPYTVAKFYTFEKVIAFIHFSLDLSFFNYKQPNLLENSPINSHFRNFNFSRLCLLLLISDDVIHLHHN